MTDGSIRFSLLALESNVKERIQGGVIDVVDCGQEISEPMPWGLGNDGNGQPLDSSNHNDMP